MSIKTPILVPYKRNKRFNYIQFKGPSTITIDGNIRVRRDDRYPPQSISSIRELAIYLSCFMSFNAYISRGPVWSEYTVNNCRLNRTIPCGL